MKRLIKYTSPYEDIEFSDCSTNYEVLPYVVDDNAGTSELRALAGELGYEVHGNAKHLTDAVIGQWNTRSLNVITDSLVVGYNDRIDSWSKKLDTRRPLESVRLGFITIYSDTDSIKLDEGCNGVLSGDQLQSIFNEGQFDMRDIITIDSETMLLIEAWGAYHYLELMGYKFSQLLELAGCESTIFDDSVYSCGECGEWGHNDNGYTYNYRIVDSELLGLECGCYKDHMMENFEDRIDDTETPLELEVAETLEGENKIKHLERFIGGMTDGRGGYYGGESCSEGDPAQILKEYQAKMPDTQFILTHDESGQFQTYFSIWEVL